MRYSISYFWLSLAAATGAGAIIMNTAQAAPVAVSSQLGAIADRLSPIEKTQFIIGGREYCWYEDGWNGPGWYRCGYYLRPGFGWGGPSGWHNWHHGPGSEHNPPTPTHGPGTSHNPVSPPKGITPPRQIAHPPVFKPVPIPSCSPGGHCGKRI
jgi:hypothetical protein